MPRTSLAPTLLLAMPQLDDPNFARTVVLLCREDEEGAMGLVLNRRSDTPVSSIVDFDPPLTGDNGTRVWIGGPVEPHRGWLLLGHDPHSAEAMRVADDLFLSASMHVLRAVVETPRPRPCRFLLGYAGWGEGQLGAEIAASSWLCAEVSRDIVFDTAAEDMWEKAIRGLGIDPFLLQTGGGVH